MKVNKNLLVVSVLVLLVLISSIQAVQLFNMKSDIKDIQATGQSIKTSASKTSSSGSSSSGGVPTNLQNLPGMVGGC